MQRYTFKFKSLLRIQPLISVYFQLSKASMLQKGAEYIKHLRNERTVVQEQMEALKKEMETLNNSLK